MNNRETPALLQHLCSTNDANGNPRRIWAVYSATGVIVDAIDEGYSGKGEKYRNRTDLVELPAVAITPGEYREWLTRVEHLNGRYAVCDGTGFVWHRFYTKPRALKYRREHYAPERLNIVDLATEGTS